MNAFPVISPVFRMFRIFPCRLAAAAVAAYFRMALFSHSAKVGVVFAAAVIASPLQAQQAIDGEIQTLAVYNGQCFDNAARPRCRKSGTGSVSATDPITLTPTFSPDAFRYNADILTATNGVSVIATNDDGAGSFRIAIVGDGAKNTTTTIGRAYLSAADPSAITELQVRKSASGQVYTITFGALATDSALSSLTATGFMLSPAFVINAEGADTDAVYSIGEIPHSVTSLQIIAKKRDDDATIAATDLPFDSSVPDSGNGATVFTVDISDVATDGSTVGSFVITVTAADGETDTAYTLNFTRAIPPPAAPMANATNIGNGKFTLNWTAPASAAAINHYDVRWGDADSFLNSGGAEGNDVAATLRQFVITGLTNGTEYSARVRADSGTGGNRRAGEWSAIVRATPLALNSADLLGLTLSNSVAVAESIAAATTAYTAIAPKSVAEITITASGTTNGSGATLSLKLGTAAAQTISNGVASSAQTLAIGENVFTLVITSPDSSVMKTYTLTITRTDTPAEPDAPMLTTPATDSDSSIAADWDALPDARNGGAEITGYRIRWGVSTGGSAVAWSPDSNGQEVPSNMTDFVIMELDAETAYDVQIAAENANGGSAWSSSATHTTSVNQSDALLATLGISGTGGDTNEITPVPIFAPETFAYQITSAFESDGIRLLPTYAGSGASLTYTGASDAVSVDSGSGADIPVSAGAAVTAYLTVTAADGITTQLYTFTIMRGAGKPAQPTGGLSLAQDPNAAGGIVASWSFTNATNGSAITRYRVRWRAGNTSAWSPNAAGEAVAPATYTISGLTPDPATTQYQVQFAAENAIGAGDFSAGASTRASGAPDMPSALTLTPGHGSLTANWTNPTFTGGPAINGYGIRTRLTSGGTWQTISTTNKPHTITGLLGGNQYDVQVRAHNKFGADGMSPWSATQVAIPTRKALSVTADNKSKVYGAADPVFTFSVSGFISSDNKNNVFGSNVPFGRAAGETVGDYAFAIKNTITYASAAAGGKYNVTLVAGNKLAITQKTVTYSSTDADKTYDGNVNRPDDLMGSFDGLVNATVNGITLNDTGKLTLTGGEYGNKNQGARTIVGTTANPFGISGDAVANYALGSVSITGTISALSTTATVSVPARVYDAGASVPLGTVSFDPPILGGDTVTIDQSAAAYLDANVGTAKSTSGYSQSGAQSGNYAVLISVSGDVTKRPLTVTAGGEGATAPTDAELGDFSLLTAGEGDNVGLAGSESLADVLMGKLTLGDLTGETSTGGGQHALTGGTTALNAAAGANYTLNVVDGIFRIEDPGKQTLNITPTAVSIMYGDADPTLAYSVAPISGSAFLTDDNANTEFFTEVPFTRTAGDDVAAYAFVAKDPLPFSAGIAAKYNFRMSDANSFNITPRPANLGDLTLTRAYNGGTVGGNAEVSGGITNLVGSESFSLTLAAAAAFSFANKNVGSGIAITGLEVADLELVSDNAASKPGNYTIALTGTNTGEITAKAITAENVTVSKVYDGGVANTGSSVSGNVITGVSGEDFTLSLTAGEFSAADVGASGLAFNGAAFALTLANSDSDPANYSVPALTVTAEITPKEVSVAEVTLTKIYDATAAGTPGAGISTGGGAVSDVISPQSFTLQPVAASVGVYASADVGENIGVSGLAFELRGANANSKPGNYSLPAVIAINGIITARELSVPAGAVVYKVYDSTADIISSGNVPAMVDAEIAGAAGEQTFTLNVRADSDAAFTAADAANPAALSDFTTDDLALIGASDDSKPENYTLAAGIAISGRIDPRPVTIAQSVVSKEYDGGVGTESIELTTAGAVTGTVGDDSLRVKLKAGALGGGAFNSRNVGTNIPVSNADQFLEVITDVAETNADNYAVPASAPVVGEITQNDDVSVDLSTLKIFKSYDGGAAIGDSMATADLTGVAPGDVLAVSVLTAVYATTELAEDSVAISDLTFGLASGDNGATDPNNYVVPPELATVTEVTDGSIRKKVLGAVSGDGMPVSKVYDGDVTAPTVTAVPTGVIGGDNVGFTLGEYNSKNVLDATGISVTLTGNNIGNYLAPPEGLPATITPKPVAYTISGSSVKVYDGNLSPPPGIRGTINAGELIAADTGKVAVTFGDYDNKNVADATSVAVAFTAGAGGDESANYSPDPATTAATISKRPITVTAFDVSALTRPAESALKARIEPGATGEGLVDGETAADALTGELAFGTADADGIAAIERGSLAATANYEITKFNDGEFSPGGPFDVDGVTGAGANDGILIARYLVGIRDDATLIKDMPPGTSAADVRAIIADGVDSNAYDVDGDSNATAADAILIARYFLGVIEDPGLTADISGADADDVVQNIKAQLPSSQ